MYLAKAIIEIYESRDQNPYYQTLRLKNVVHYIEMHLDTIRPPDFGKQLTDIINHKPHIVERLLYGVDPDKPIAVAMDIEPWDDIISKGAIIVGDQVPTGTLHPINMDAPLPPILGIDPAKDSGKLMCTMKMPDGKIWCAELQPIVYNRPVPPHIPITDDDQRDDELRRDQDAQDRYFDQ